MIRTMEMAEAEVVGMIEMALGIRTSMEITGMTMTHLDKMGLDFWGVEAIREVEGAILSQGEGTIL
jgi:hypothetical protein